MTVQPKCPNRNIPAARLSLVLALAVLCSSLLLAGTTGKVAGRVTDATTKDPLIGANVMVVGTNLGTTTDVDGYYTINNLPPGKYTIVVGFIGYRKSTVTDVVVKIDLTTKVDVVMNSEALQGEEVVVRAERPLVQKDLTSTSVTVSSDELKRIPMENLQQVVNVQAGVVGGHFRGGRSNGVAYLIDGISVTDPYNGQMSVQVSNSSVREMEVISGTFNAEYGQAMSGVVNTVLQEGSDSYHGSLSLYSGDYVTNHTDVFPNIGSLTKLRIKNVQASVSGRVPLVENLSFYVSGRYYHDNGYLYGKRVYSVNDRAPYKLRDPGGNAIKDAAGNDMYVYTATGDGAYVPMNPTLQRSANMKVAYTLGELKFGYTVLYDNNWNKYYDHGFSWTPDGTTNHYRADLVNSLQITHTISANTYQTLKAAHNYFDYKGYLYEDPYDSRYVDPNVGTPISNYTFRSGGNQADRYDRYSRSTILQWAINSQVTQKHKVGMGVEVKQHQVYNHWTTIMNRNTVQTDSTGALIFEIGYPDPGTLNNQAYTKKPVELAAYLQDKMEYDIMIINAGLRLDYFDPKADYPSDLKNPSGPRKAAAKKIQLSPRLGVSFPITDEGIIHFSYGHFFQIPSFENLYYNSAYLVDQGGSLSSIIGNPDLEAQRTVMYELGLQQVIFPNVSLDFTIYSRDIRNLLGMEILSTYEGFKYTRFINRDYASVKGAILSIDKRFADYFGMRVDYTYQIAEGNASDPYSVYYNNQSDPPTETNKKVVPLNWDQRSTLNFSVSVGEPGDWTVGVLAQFGTGFPYTESIRVSNGLRFENGGTKPATQSVDLRAEKTFRIADLNLTLFALVYNVLDAKNEHGVNDASGRTNIDIFKDEAGPIIGLNTQEQYINNPANFSAPRQIRLGVTMDF